MSVVVEHAILAGSARDLVFSKTVLSVLIISTTISASSGFAISDFEFFLKNLKNVRNYSIF